MFCKIAIFKKIHRMFKKTTKYCAFLALFVVFLLVFQSCSKNVTRMQGKWSAAGDLGDSTDMRAWYIIYEFNGSNYKMSGYPPISEEGSYEVVQEKGDSLQVYFNVTNSSPETKSHKDWIFLKDSTMTAGQLVLHKTN